MTKSNWVISVLAVITIVEIGYLTYSTPHVPTGPFYVFPGDKAFFEDGVPRSEQPTWAPGHTPTMVWNVAATPEGEPTIIERLDALEGRVRALEGVGR